MCCRSRSYQKKVQVQVQYFRLCERMTKNKNFSCIKMLGPRTLLLVLFSVSLGTAHVRLNFPEGRDLTLDFLDSFRTPAPCGMPKGQAKTTLANGSPFNVTWHLGYPHRGGYKIELLDSHEKFIMNLTPEDGGSKGDGWIDDDTTAQSHLVSLPSNIKCDGCTVIQDIYLSMGGLQFGFLLQKIGWMTIFYLFWSLQIFLRMLISNLI